MTNIRRITIRSSLRLAFVFVALAFCLTPAKGEVFADYRVIPRPLQTTLTSDGGFILKSSTKIVYPEGNEKMARNALFLSDYIKTATGLDLKLECGEAGRNAIVLSLDSSRGNPEGYTLTVSKRRVTITSSSEAGVFYAIQTLRKSLPFATGQEIELPAVLIEDSPRFSYRGAHFDIARHFYGVEEIERYIDMMVLHNINRLHLHLTDNQGWRLEIRKYPKLLEIGSKRSFDGEEYGGYLTQDEARQIVRYAEERYVTVIPEIDLPSHMQAAIASYPSLGCTGSEEQDVLCAGNDTTLQFIDDVLLELIDIFPSRYIHIGGDECPKTWWEACPKCQARIKQLGLSPKDGYTSEQRLQSFITSHVADLLARYGRLIIGWDEILEGGLAASATVMSWRGESGGIAAARLGHDAIMTPGDYLYFDHAQSLDTTNEPGSWGGYLPVSQVYSYEPVPTQLSAEEQQHIIGLQSNLWTEHIATFPHVEYMVLPRWAAMCEVQWSPEGSKDYPDFLSRLPRLLRWYDAEGYNYAKHVLGKQ